MVSWYFLIMLNGVLLAKRDVLHLSYIIRQVLYKFFFQILYFPIFLGSAGRNPDAAKQLRVYTPILSPFRAKISSIHRDLIVFYYKHVAQVSFTSFQLS